WLSSRRCPMEALVSYRTVQVDGLNIFYRESGSKDGPVLLLLHGLPSSSRMYEPLLRRLGSRYRMVAPDYPGFGHSDWPDRAAFSYSFDNIAARMTRFAEVMNLRKYSLYMQDYGGPVGFRIALAHPDRVQSLIVQNAVAHDTGLGENWALRRAFWADRAKNEPQLRANLLSLAATRLRHVGSDPNLERYDPDLWTDEFVCAIRSPACLLSGANTTLLSITPSRNRFKRMCRQHKSVSSTADTLPSIRPPTTSPASLTRCSRLCSMVLARIAPLALDPSLASASRQL